MAIQGHYCKHCKHRLTDVLQRPIKRARHAKPKMTHAHAGRFAVSLPVGYEVVGFCNIHGLQHNVPFGPPELESAPQYAVPHLGAFE